MNWHIITRKSIAAISLLAFSLAGCLKDKDFDNGVIQSFHSETQNQNVVEIGLTGTSTVNFKTLSFDPLNVDTSANIIPVVLASPNVASEDVKVTLIPDSTLVSAYNEEHGSVYEVPASSMYSVVDGGVVTIPKGSRTGFLQIKLTPSAFTGKTWALGFKIASVDKQNYLVSGNLNTGIIGIVIKSIYDGNYTGAGARIRFSGGTEDSGVRDSFAVEGTIPLSTLDAKTVIGQAGDDGSGYTMALQVNDTGTPPYNVTVLPDPTADPGGTPDSFIPGTSRGESTYDPTTKTFDLHFGYLTAAGALRQVNETLVKE